MRTRSNEKYRDKYNRKGRHDLQKKEEGKYICKPYRKTHWTSHFKEDDLRNNKELFSHLDLMMFRKLLDQEHFKE